MESEMSIRSDEGPEETITFVYGKMGVGDGGQTFDNLGVDPTNPNSEVDGRDFLVWQRGNATPSPDDNVAWPIGPIPEFGNVEWPIGPIPELNTEALTIVHEGFLLV
jgi:hypothetical protein